MGTGEGEPVNGETEVSRVITREDGAESGRSGWKRMGLEKDLQEMDSQRVAESRAILVEFRQVLFHQPVKGGKRTFPPQRGL